MGGDQVHAYIANIDKVGYQNVMLGYGEQVLRKLLQMCKMETPLFSLV